MSDQKNGPSGPDDVPLSDAELRRRYDNCSIMKIKRARANLGMPGPHFRIGQTPYTWRSAVLEWEQRQAAAYRLDGVPVRKPSNVEAA